MFRYCAALWFCSVAANVLSAADSSQAHRVGSQVCGGCHTAIFKRFRTTPMGQSVEAAEASGAWAATLPVTVHSESLDRYFEVYRKESTLYQKEYAVAQGERTFENSYKLDYVIGSGENGRTPVVRRGNFLVEAPLTFYTKAGKWALSPGFESQDSAFNRPILEPCIRCHSGLPQPSQAGNGRYNDPAFKEMSISCENCHGPGSVHAEQRGRGVEVAGTDTTIVNPKKLPARMADEICMACHQGGDTRILQPGKTYSDIQPGVPLAQALAIFKAQPQRGASSSKDLLEHNAAMTLSRCYRASAGKLSCLTCHDPHERPAAGEAAAYYRERCLACHSEASLNNIPRHKRGADCISCHMPKRAVAEISHSQLTNHRIVRTPDEPLPDEYYTHTTPGLPGLLYVNSPNDSGSLPLLTKLSAYGELQAQAPELAPEYLRVFEQARKTIPDDPLVLAAAGRAALIEARYEDAARLLKRAVSGASPPSPWLLDLASALVQLSRAPEAVDILARAANGDPFNTTIQKTEILTLINLHEYQRALEALRQYVAAFPEDLFMRGLLKKVDVPQAAPR